MTVERVNLNGLLGAIIVLIFLALSLIKPPLHEAFEGFLLDIGMKFASVETRGTHDIAIIEIDDRSLARYGQWPWPRHIIADMITLLNKHGVRLIGLNMSFHEKQNQGLLGVRAFRETFTTYSAGRVNKDVADWVLENLRSLEESLDDDKKLVESVERGGNVILPVIMEFDGKPRDLTRDEDLILGENLLTPRGSTGVMEHAGSPARLSLPFFELARHASGVGYKPSGYGGQSSGRSHPMVVVYRRGLLPSFPLRLAIAYAGQSPKQVIVDKDRIQLAGTAIPVTKEGVLIRFRKYSDGFPTYSFSDVLETGKIPQDLKGKIVMIGPQSIEAPGRGGAGFSQPSETESFARILDSIIHGSFIKRPSFMVIIEMLTTLLVGAFGIIVFPRLGQLKRLGLVVGLTVLTIVSGLIVLSKMDVWFKTGYVLNCLITIYVVISISLLLTSAKTSRKAIETNRLLGLNFQSQGLLDLAFDKFQRLPLDTETKDLMYNLGLAYENKKLIDNAIAVYEYIRKGGPFRDLDQRIPKLVQAGESSLTGSHDDVRGLPVAEDVPLEDRKRIGRYEVVEVLGKGSMGVVYKATDPRINRTLAIKTIRFSDEFDEEIIQEVKERFFKEAEIAGKLAHPSIVTIFDVGEDGDLTYMAMEYLEGRDLDKFVSKGKLLTFRKILNVVAMIAEALDYAHRADVIHRDIKPANIMLLDNGGVKVTDFGIAKAISSSRTRTGVILGTPNYMSPEQIMGQKIDTSSDIFSLGVLFFQLTTGELPFHAENLSSLLYQITQVKHPPLRQYNPRMPAICEKILDKALAKNPDERFRTAADMAKVLRLVAARMDQLVQKRSSEEMKTLSSE